MKYGEGRVDMRFYFVPKRKLLGSITIFLLLILFIGGAISYWSSRTIASDLLEPIYQGNTGKKVVAITVNVDWGEEFIPDMLKEFEKNQALVTFFVTGKWAEKNPELLKEMAKKGHSIQNHGYQHCHFNRLSSDQIVSEIKKAEDTIFHITGQRSSFFASPYGESNPQLVRVVKDMKYRFVMWSVDTIDWQRPSPETIIKRVMNKVHNDSIILMHPTDPTVKALPGLLQLLREDKYRMMTIDKVVIDRDKPTAKKENKENK